MYIVKRKCDKTLTTVIPAKPWFGTFMTKPEE
jgi:hypothetical protein